MVLGIRRARRSSEKDEVVSHFQSATSSGAFWLCFSPFLLFRQQAFPPCFSPSYGLVEVDAAALVNCAVQRSETDGSLAMELLAGLKPQLPELPGATLLTFAWAVVLTRLDPDPKLIRALGSALQRAVSESKKLTISSSSG